jgi:hypothetical protein
MFSKKILSSAILIANSPKARSIAAGVFPVVDEV